ncbi:MAG: hypothetical protein Tsb002_01430 [Wenzhouxiangellaceae bacterium]
MTVNYCGLVISRGNKVWNRILTYTALLLFSASTSAQQAEGGGNNFLESARGFGVETFFDGSFSDAVNTFNGNAIVNIPLGPEFQAGQISYRLNLNYNAKAWEFYTRCEDLDGDGIAAENCADMAIPDPYANAGMGWRIGFGELYEPKSQVDPTVFWPNHSSSDWLYVTPDGSRIQIGIDPHRDDGFLYSQGGQHVRMRLEPFNSITRAVIEFPNGERHRFLRTTWGDCRAAEQCWKLTDIRDQYDQGIDFNYVQGFGSSPPWSVEITDTDGREHEIDYALLSPPADDEGAYHIATNKITLNKHAVNSERFIINFNYGESSGGSISSAMQTLKREYPHTWGDDADVRVPLLRELRFPEGLNYTFDYHIPGSSQENKDSGSLTQYTLPTGASIKFEYADYELPKACDLLLNQDGIGGVPRHNDSPKFAIRGVVKKPSPIPLPAWITAAIVRQ